MLEHCKDMREGRRVTSEGSERVFFQCIEIIVVILSSIHEQCCELLCLLLIQISDSHLRQPIARVSSHHKQWRLHTQNRHKANRVSNVRTIRKCACLCGML